MSSRSKHGGPADAATVTANQRAILLRLFAGEAEHEIAATSGRKSSTIFNTVRRVRDQLGARNEYDLFRKCLSRGIITLDEINALADTLPRAPRRATGGPRR
jgi:DNA-binding NarL/FixJ family response regulator